MGKGLFKAAVWSKVWGAQQTAKSRSQPSSRKKRSSSTKESRKRAPREPSSSLRKRHSGAMGASSHRARTTRIRRVKIGVISTMSGKGYINSKTAAMNDSHLSLKMPN